MRRKAAGAKYNEKKEDAADCNTARQARKDKGQF
jgi:hypothetical protein